ncbi:MAG: Asp-tRNA(Asn)/Glu-tRNA(Gln) amidotransferase subunit GatB [Elusimicrobia bacterium]|nr:Asp-tRNA(Asn)/Glu-tRNA(Gln) amidotransferase subunit GatB [Elusimicrobiota bacterium]
MKPTIGLEIHVQLATASKLFCSCPASSFGAPPNQNICPICAGDPGVLPVANRQAVERLIRMGLALNCAIAERSVFARKSYFYPDLPKNYQISQYDLPLAKGGRLQYFSGGEKRTARIHRIHLEEDAGKLLHAIGAQELAFSLVDFNRTGVALAETVTEPDFNNAQEANDFLTTLRTTLRSLNVSNCDMEKGEFRVDVNVSVAPEGAALGTRVEIKNLNSFKAVRDALEYEIKRQKEALAGGEKIRQETRLWDVKNAATEALRSKEEASDYRYFAEPDLKPLIVSREWIERVRGGLAPLPVSRAESYEGRLGLGSKEAQTIAFHEDSGVAALFEETVGLCSVNGQAVEPKTAANWILNDLLGNLKDKNRSVADSGMTAERLAGFLKLVRAEGLSSRLAKDLFAKMLADPALEAGSAFKASGVTLLSSEDALLVFIREALQENPRAVEEFKSGKERAIQSLVGAVMKKTKGQAHPQKLQELLRRELTR